MGFYYANSEDASLDVSIRQCTIAAVLSKHTMRMGPLQILLPGVCPSNRLIHIKIGPKQILCMKSALLYCVCGVYTHHMAWTVVKQLCQLWTKDVS